MALLREEKIREDIYYAIVSLSPEDSYRILKDITENLEKLKNKYRQDLENAVF